MSIHIDCRLLSIYLVLGKVYLINTDAIQRTCLRVRWGSKVKAWGPKPEMVMDLLRKAA